MPNLEGIITTATAVAANNQLSIVGSFLGRTILVNPAIPVALAVACIGIVAFIFYKVYSCYPEKKIQNEVTLLPKTPEELLKINEELTVELKKVQSQLEALSKTDKNNEAANKELTTRIKKLTFELNKVKNKLNIETLQRNATREKNKSQVAKTKKIQKQLIDQISETKKVQQKLDVHVAKINERQELVKKVRTDFEKGKRLLSLVNHSVQDVEPNTQLFIKPDILSLKEAVESFAKLEKEISGQNNLSKSRFLLANARGDIYRFCTNINNSTKIVDKNPELKELIDSFKSMQKQNQTLKVINEMITTEYSVMVSLEKGLNLITHLLKLNNYFQSDIGRHNKERFENILISYQNAQELSNELFLQFIEIIHGDNKLNEKEMAVKVNEILSSELFIRYSNSMKEANQSYVALKDNLEKILKRVIKFETLIEKEKLNTRVKDLSDRLKTILPVPFQRMGKFPLLLRDLSESLKKTGYVDDILFQAIQSVKQIMVEFNKENEGSVNIQINFPKEANYVEILAAEKEFSIALKEMVISTDELLNYDCFKFLRNWNLNPLNSLTSTQKTLQKRFEKLKVIKANFQAAYDLSIKVISTIESLANETSEFKKIEGVHTIYASDTFKGYMNALLECTQAKYKDQGISLPRTIQTINTLKEEGAIDVGIDNDRKSKILLLQSAAIQRKAPQVSLENLLKKYLQENKPEEPEVTVGVKPETNRFGFALPKLNWRNGETKVDAIEVAPPASPSKKDEALVK